MSVHSISICWAGTMAEGHLLRFSCDRAYPALWPLLELLFWRPVFNPGRCNSFDRLHLRVADLQMSWREYIMGYHDTSHSNGHLGPILLTWFHFNPIMDKLIHPTFYNGCDYLSMVGLKLNHVSKRGYCGPTPICLHSAYTITARFAN